MEHTGAHVPPELLQYMRDEDLLQYFTAEELRVLDTSYVYVNPDFGCRAGDVPFPPDVKDLVFLHKKVRQRKCFTVLEFGLGYSTFIMADALVKNRKEYEELGTNQPHIRCSNKFELHTLDNEPEWIDSCKKRMEQHENLSGVVHFHVSTVSATTFNGRMCHAYDSIPNVVPDFIYLDAPSTESITGSVNGMNFLDCSDRTVMAADVCIMEPLLIPGCFIVVDGRVNNTRFMKNNFQRSWKFEWLRDLDVTIFELDEEPLGELNLNRLKYCGLA